MKSLLFAVCLIAMCGCSAQQKNLQSSAVPSVLIDVRTPDERAKFGYINGSICIVHTEIGDKISKFVPDRNTAVGVYCRSGRRSAMAAKVLKKRGYTKVTDYGGFKEAAKKLNLPVVNAK